MVTDRQGNSVSGASGEAAALYDQALWAFNIYRGDPVALLDSAVAAAPDFAMATIMKAHLYALSTEPEGLTEAANLVATAKTLTLNEREASHIAALELLLRNEWSAAAIALDRHNLTWPRDLLAIQSGHLMDFFRANARDMRDRIARVLPQWSAAIPGYSFLLGFQSFGLEEAGDYARAEAAGRQALTLEPLDCWAHHAVAHVMEMQGRFQDGLGWMIAREPHWTGDDNFFQVHNWWHRALYHFELGEIDQILALYDGPIRSGRSAVAVDLVDASALLWRLQLAGHDVGDRWVELTAAWDPIGDGKLYPFNDLHAVMAHLGAGREADVERILACYRETARSESEVAGWVHDYGLPLIEGFAAFWRGDHATATERLYGARYIANGFGGSHAQRDVIDWTLTEASLRGGQKILAEGLAQERLAAKPHSPINLGFLKRARSQALGVQDAA
ncbi:MAG: tetratricopeptide repeat protein [Rhodospirillales bacterium]